MNTKISTPLLYIIRYYLLPNSTGLKLSNKKKMNMNTKISTPLLYIIRYYLLPNSTGLKLSNQKYEYEHKNKYTLFIYH